MERIGSGTVSDLDKLEKFLNDSYRWSYLEGYVKGGIAYQIQALREKMAMNQTEFGSLIGKPQSVVSRLEDTEYGAVNVNTLIEIANHLKIGLQIRFCDFQTVLDADMSPQALAVENINETIDRLLTPLSPQTVSYPVISESVGTGIWQMNPIPNQTPFLLEYPEVETPNTAMFTRMPVSPASGHLTSA